MTKFLRRDNKASSNDAAETVVSAEAASGGDGTTGSAVDESIDITASDPEQGALDENSDAAESVGSKPFNTATLDVLKDATAGESGAATATHTDAHPTTNSLRWAPAASIRKGYGGSAVSFALAGLATSFFVGWAFPLALIGIALGIVAVRKPEESSRLGAWAIALGTLATIYSAGWLWWANTQLHWFG